jgi:hypothetical protein
LVSLFSHKPARLAIHTTGDAGKSHARHGYCGSIRVSPETVVAWIANKNIQLKKTAVSRAIRRDAELNPRDAGAIKSDFKKTLRLGVFVVLILLHVFI